jgi:hypothetical protein
MVSLNWQALPSLKPTTTLLAALTFSRLLPLFDNSVHRYESGNPLGSADAEPSRTVESLPMANVWSFPAIAVLSHYNLL